MSVISIIGAVLCLAVLIGWHELGHFIAARACGVHVIRFSIGFGKSLFSWTDSKGTAYTLAAIPFGGYVRMLGEDALSEESDQARDTAFSAKAVWQRLIIVLAGPFANILLAFILFTVINLAGVTQLKPVIGEVISQSPAMSAGVRSGEEIVAVDGVATASWKNVALHLVSRIGDTGSVVITTMADQAQERSYDLKIQSWLSQTIDPDPLLALGITPFRLAIPAVIDVVQPDGAAAQAGLLPQDSIVAANGNAIDDWRQIVAVIRQSPSIPVDLVIERQGKQLPIVIVPAAKDGEQAVIGFAGISAQSVDFPENMLLSYRPGLFEAAGSAFTDTYDLGLLVLVSMYKLIVGDIALGNISGPIGIVKVAGQSAAAGVLAFLSFAAYLSISLGILNLLPVPVLDGGQAVFLCIEGLVRREVPRYVQEIAMRFGIVALVSLMVLATIYDIYKL